MQAVLLGLISNAILAILKTGFGILGHSPALLAEGINSTSDVAYSLVVSIFVKLATKPADEEHPYGHSQLESIGALLVGAFVITTAISIFWNSINSIFDIFTGNSSFTESSISALIVALVTVVVKIALTIYTTNLGKTMHNPSIIALSQDHKNDIFSAIAAVIGITFGRIGFSWVDPLAGAVVSIIILMTGIQILRESTSDLMDTIPGRTLRKEVNVLTKQINGVLSIEDIHAHRFGPYLSINITICVDGDLSVLEGDRIATQVEQILFKNIDLLRYIHVHYHPYRLKEIN